LDAVHWDGGTRRLTNLLRYICDQRIAPKTGADLSAAKPAGSTSSALQPLVGFGRTSLDLDQFAAQTVPQRVFRTEFFEQGLGLGDCFVGYVGALKELSPH